MQVFREGDVLKRRTDVPDRWLMWVNRCVVQGVNPSTPQRVVKSSPSLGIQLELLPTIWWQHQWFERAGPVIEKELEDYL